MPVGTKLAGATSVLTLYNPYGTTPVPTGSYTTIIAATPSPINRLQIQDTSGSGFVVAVGAAASEVNQFLIGPGGVTMTVDIFIPAGSRVSMKAVDTSAASGALFLTGIY